MILPLREKVMKSWSCEARVLALTLYPTGCVSYRESLSLSEPAFPPPAIKEVDKMLS